MELAQKCNVIIAVLPGLCEVADVCFGEDGIIKGLKPTFLAQQFYQTARQKGLYDRDNSALIKIFEELLDVVSMRVTNEARCSIYLPGLE
ncbi:MAG: hypothetical protein ACOWWO_00240 [Peptococcaceae bacterium]